jgi:hypothetical protein
MHLQYSNIFPSSMFIDLWDLSFEKKDDTLIVEHTIVGRPLYGYTFIANVVKLVPTLFVAIVSLSLALSLSHMNV